MALGGIVFMALLTLGVVAWLMPADLIARIGTERAEAALGMDVSIADLGIDIWPIPAVALDSVRIGSAASPLATVARVRLHPRILPLFSGRVIVDEIVFERPRIIIRIDSTGSDNLPMPAASDAIKAAEAVANARRGAEVADSVTTNAGNAANAPPPDEPDRAVAFTVREFRIDNGRVDYRNIQNGSALQLGGLDQRLRMRGEFQGARLANIHLAGTLGVASFTVKPAGDSMVTGGLPLEVNHDVTLDLASDRLSLNRLRIGVAGVLLEGEGEVEAVSHSSARAVTLAMQTDTFDISDLLVSLPRAWLGPPANGEDSGAGSLAPPEVDGRAFVRLDLEGPATPDSIPRLAGTVRLVDVSTRVSGDEILTGLNGRIGFSMHTVATTGLEGRLLGDPFRLTFTAVNLSGPGVPTVQFQARAGALDLDRVLAPSRPGYPSLLFARLGKRRVDGRTADELAESAGLALPELPDIRARGTLAADRILRNGLAYDAVAARIVLTPDSVTVPRARFGFMGGSIELAARFRPDPEGGELAVDYTLTDVGAEPFFSRLTPLRQHLGGMLRLAGRLRTRLDPHALPVRESVRASGSAALRDGRLIQWPLLKAIGSRLALARFDTLNFQDWTGTFSIDGPRVTMRETDLSASEITAVVGGWFDFSGELDLDATVRLPGSMAARAAEPIRRVAAAASGRNGTIPVGLDLTGTLDKPGVALDLSDAQGAIIRAAREAAEREAGQLADRALDEIRARTGLDSSRVSLDSLPAAVDSLLPDSAGLDSIAGAVTDAVDSIAGGLGDLIPFLSRPAVARDSAGAEDTPPDSAGVDSAGAEAIQTDSARADSAAADTLKSDTLAADTTASSPTDGPDGPARH